MLIPSHFTEDNLFAVVRLRTVSDGGEGFGTGFFASGKISGNTGRVFLITNKHVIRGAKSGSMRMHEGTDNKPTGKTFEVVLDSFESRFIHHPNPDVDLCAMGFAPIKLRANELGITPFVKPLKPDVFPTQKMLEDLTAVEPVTMYGFPIGLSDEANNLPIIRRGTTASHPSISFDGKPYGVADIACFPGSSGSPVFYMDRGIMLKKRSDDWIRDMSFGEGYFFLGVLFAGPSHTGSGAIAIEEIPTQSSISVRVPQMIHLGYYVKAHAVRELLDLAESKG